jgi:hypothetical protein
VVWRILARYVNSGKSLDAILKSSKERLTRIGGIMKSLLVLALAAIFLIPLAGRVTAAPAVEAVPGKNTRLPFKGTMQSNETYSKAFYTQFVAANGSGEATELGKFTATYQMEVNLLDMSVSESVSLAGTNGDSLQATAVGQVFEDRTPGMFKIIEIYTITGGTGRFADASGTLTMSRLLSMEAGIASSTFEGYILLPP